MSAPQEHSPAGSGRTGRDGNDKSNPDKSDSTRLASELDECRRRCEQFEDRERRIAELLHSKSPERIEHDLRNVMNELQLLRTLFEKQGG